MHLTTTSEHIKTCTATTKSKERNKHTNSLEYGKKSGDIQVSGEQAKKQRPK